MAYPLEFKAFPYGAERVRSDPNAGTLFRRHLNIALTKLFTMRTRDRIARAAEMGEQFFKSELLSVRADGLAGPDPVVKTGRVDAAVGLTGELREDVVSDVVDGCAEPLREAFALSDGEGSPVT